MDSKFSHKNHPQNQSFHNVKTIGNFQSYPNGIWNPAFSGMIFWEHCQDHICNNYKISQFNNIRSRIIINGTLAYIFTLIENNDIKSDIIFLFLNEKCVLMAIIQSFVLCWFVQHSWMFFFSLLGLALRLGNIFQYYTSNFFILCIKSIPKEKTRK